MSEKDQAEYKKSVEMYKKSYEKKIRGIVPINKDGTNRDGMPYHIYPSGPAGIKRELEQYQEHAPTDVPENGEVSVEFTNGAKVYFRRGPNGEVVIGRGNDRPAVEFEDGTKIYVKNGVAHRENGPAYIGKSLMGGDVECYYNEGVLHRLDGPAVIKWESGKNTYGDLPPSAVEFYIKGEKMSPEQFEFVEKKVKAGKVGGMNSPKPDHDGQEMKSPHM